MKAVINKGVLTITIPLATDPQPSASGKSLTLASTRGNVKPEGLKHEGKQVTIGLNVYVPAGGE